MLFLNILVVLLLFGYFCVSDIVTICFCLPFLMCRLFVCFVICYYFGCFCCVFVACCFVVALLLVILRLFVLVVLFVFLVQTYHYHVVSKKPIAARGVPVAVAGSHRSAGVRRPGDNRAP